MAPGKKGEPLSSGERAGPAARAGGGVAPRRGGAAHGAGVLAPVAAADDAGLADRPRVEALDVLEHGLQRGARRRSAGEEGRQGAVAGGERDELAGLGEVAVEPGGLAVGLAQERGVALVAVVAAGLALDQHGAGYEGRHQEAG